MKVVMLQNVKGVGQKDSIVEVSDGFALNSLIPQGKAAQATGAQLASLEKRKADRAQMTAHRNEETRALLDKLNGKKIIMRVRANDRGSLFKGVTKEDIAKTIGSTMGTKCESSLIQGLQSPIKEVGEYDIRLTGAGGAVTVRLVLEAEGKGKEDRVK